MESTTSYTFPVHTGGIFYFPWHRHQIEGTNGFQCLIRKTQRYTISNVEVDDTLLVRENPLHIINIHISIYTGIACRLSLARLRPVRRHEYTYARVCACMRVYARARVCACMRVYARVCACVHVCVCLHTFFG